MIKMHWKKRKTLAMLANRRQSQRQFDPTVTIPTEIQAEQNDILGRNLYIVTETIFDPNNNNLNYYIIAE
jgi:hypothetical protein|tara:strand:- start:213 stop:422 length:210 start_codon:yes stop_codon:yes gene_type:complete